MIKTRVGVVSLATLIVLATAGSRDPAFGLDVKQVSLHADIVDPLYAWKGVRRTGRRSRFAVGPGGEIVFLYSQSGNVHWPTFLALGRVGRDGRITREALSSSAPSPRNDGWPFDIAFAAPGDVRLVCDIGKYKSGFRYWYRRDGVWRAEAGGENVTLRTSSFSLALGRDGQPVVVSMACAPGGPTWKAQPQLVVWRRTAEGQWTSEQPEALKGAAAPDFDAATLPDGRLAVAFRLNTGRPACALRAADGQWTVEVVDKTPNCSFIAVEGNPVNGQPLIAYAAASADRELRELRLAGRGPEGGWRVRPVASAPEGRRVGRTDIAVSQERVLVAWHAALPKRAGSAPEGDVMLTLLDGDDKQTALVAKNCGNPALGWVDDGKHVLVGVQTSGKEGQNFAIVSVNLAGTSPRPLLPPAETIPVLRSQAVRNEFYSGDIELQRGALQTVEKQKLPQFGREAYVFFRKSQIDEDRALALRALGAVRGDGLKECLQVSLESDGLVLKQAAMPYLGALGPAPGAIGLLRKTIRKPFWNAAQERGAACVGIASLAASDEGAKDAAFQKLLIEAMTDGLPDVRRLTAESLAKRKAIPVQKEALTPLVASIVSKLFDDLKSADKKTRYIARTQLVALNEPSVNALLLKALDGDDLYLRARVAVVLARKRVPFDPGKLAPVFEEGDEKAQVEAIEAMDFAWPDGCEAVLEHALRRGSRWAKIKAVFALRAITGLFERPANSAESGPPIAPPDRKRAAAEALMAGLTDADPEVLYRSLDALGAAGHQRALAQTGKLRKHHDPRVRRSAGLAVARLGGPIHLDENRMLLVDDFAIDSMQGLTRSIRPARKHPKNPVMVGDKPWEMQRIYFYGACIYDEAEKLFKTWYKVNTHKTGRAGIDPGYQIRFLYAQSKDGIRWDKPSLGLYEFGGSKDNNIVWPDVDMMSVWKDPGEEDPSRRYKVVYWDRTGDTRALGVPDFDKLGYDEKLEVTHGLTTLHGQRGFSFAVSPDGFRWKPDPQGPAVRYEQYRDGPGGGDVLNAHHDAFHKVIRCYPKLMCNERSLGYAESLDGVRWVQPQVVLVAPKFVREPDGRKHRNHEVYYGCGVTPYQGMYIGLLWIYRMYDDWSMDIVLTTSRDGIRWQRCSDPRPIIDNGGVRKTWDGGMVLSTSHFLVVGDEVRMYYGGTFGPHTANWYPSGNGLATCKLDRFAAIHSVEGKSGTLTTRPLVFEGSQLTLNARTSGGRVLVEVLNEKGETVRGYGARECSGVQGDHLAAPVRWNDRDLRPLAGKTVRLRFILSGDADIYSFAVK